MTLTTEDFFKVWCERCLGRLALMNHQLFCGRCGHIKPSED